MNEIDRESAWIIIMVCLVFYITDFMTYDINLENEYRYVCSEINYYVLITLATK